MMKALKTMLAVHNVSFDTHDHWIMCFAHIINLCSGQVIDAASGMAGDKNTVTDYPAYLTFSFLFHFSFRFHL